jgi:hypothetical protein
LAKSPVLFDPTMQQQNIFNSVVGSTLLDLVQVWGYASLDAMRSLKPNGFSPSYSPDILLDQ